MNSHRLRILCAKFRWIGPGVLEKKMKIWQEALMGHIAQMRNQFKSTTKLWLFHNVDLERKKNNQPLFDNWMVLICKTLSALNQKMFCANVRWNWLGGSGEDFQISLMYFRLFHYFVIISPWKRARPFISTNLNLLQPRMICAKFGWNWPSDSWEEDENVKSLKMDRQMDRRMTGDLKSSLELSTQGS